MTDAALKYFYAAAVHGSMRAAGEKMNVAVSSISRQIAQLETTLGIPLIETGRRSIKLTAAGQAAVAFYQSQAAAREAFETHLEALRGLKAGVVELAAGEGFPAHAVYEALDRFLARHPGIELIVTSAGPEQIVRLVADDEVHIALGLTIPADPKLRVRSTSSHPLTAIVHRDHPLAKERSVTLTALAQHDLCLAPRGTKLRQILAPAELRLQTWLAPIITANSIQAMREVALVGRAVTVLPRIAVIDDLDQGRLVSVPLTGLEIEDARLELVTRLGRQLPHAAMLAASVIRQLIAAWPGSACVSATAVGEARRSAP